MGLIRGYYSSSIDMFLKTDTNFILGELLNNSEFETTDLQKNSWHDEIVILKQQLPRFSRGDICFEYTIPRIGHRIDVVCIIDGVIFLLEFKVGEKKHKKATEDQVMDYALDLKYFHEKSLNRHIIPITVETETHEIINSISFMEDKIASVCCCNKGNIADVFDKVLAELKGKTGTPIGIHEWISSRYAPTPTIIEAAQALYRSHSVAEISRNDAGAQNLSETTRTINDIINVCKKENKKAICFVTGVPGAGKTLAGLNIANERHKFEADEHAVFLSGNGPLVEVLQEALTRDAADRKGITKKDAERETKAFIQIIHKFRDDALSTNNPPVEKVAIFDEAQRAWNKKSLVEFMKQKKGKADFNQSEPEFLISVMDRHKSWTTIVCLVGGGQEINRGEAGIGGWLDALKNNFCDWDIYLSNKMTDKEYIGDSSIKDLLNGRKYFTKESLHLGVSLRSFRSERLSEFVKYMLDNEPEKARAIYKELSKNYPIVLTRSFERAKKWVKKEKARGNERYGLLASSRAKRLRGVGIWVLPKINNVNWFLNDKDDINSSYYLEVAASEFKVQGLELDYGLIAWDADLRYENEKFGFYSFGSNSWKNVKEERQAYLKNAYRVILTRSRQGMVIFIPKGSADDLTRNEEYYNGTYQYLKSLGIQEIF